MAVGVRTRREGDVLVVSFSGVYTPDAHRDMMVRGITEAHQAPTRAIVINLLGAVHVPRPEGEMKPPEAPPAASLSGLPIAIVGSEVERMERQCAALRSQGHLWVAFQTLPEALEWASAMAGAPAL